MKNYQNPFRTLNKLEWFIWLASLTSITLCFLLIGERDVLTLISSLIGVTALIFVAKGDPLGQILTIVFAVLYSIISFDFRYYGEMATYIGMTAPIALISTIIWFRNPNQVGKNEVKIAPVTLKKWVILIVSGAMVTFGFYFILKAFNTANLIISTVSVATSYFASALTLFRSPLYGLGYGANDIVLIIMWIMATIESITYLPMVICFVVFLANDCYGFFNWQKMRRNQKIACAKD